MELFQSIDSAGGAGTNVTKLTYHSEILQQGALKKLKTGIWVYFVLWIIEGALRKWIFPGLATPILIIRDPVAIWLLYVAWKYDRFPFNGYVLILYVITLIAIVTAVFVGHGSILVALYGARIFLIHFPLVFLIGQTFNRDDVIKLGKVLLWLAAPMAILIYFQFNSPQSAFINRGVGDNAAGAGFQGALGFFRPPGLFSFTTGNTQLFSFINVFILYFLLNQKEIKRWLIIVATLSLLVAIPLSISRTLFFQVGISVIFLIASIIRKPAYFSRILFAGVFLILLALVLSKTDFIQKPVDALTTRFENADDAEGGFFNSLKRGMADIEVPFYEQDFPFFGHGIGMGTNAGAQLLVGHSDEFLIAEGEWGRLIGELGVIMGLIVILVRIGIGLQLVRASYNKLTQNDLIPWLLVSVCLQNFAQSQWAQPATLGFSVLITGFALASLNNSENVSEDLIIDNLDKPVTNE